ncbi:hypothetical protein EGW08_020658 [Elysia chlorotica]|uniref:Uncharacterized protein n=1 Tax=Elysia chlorotica TaxID=188477 RepID=A0A3S0Z869_ELYCH|nr:hypothetical protein EGW08_020658 [Elysia chlorotica]
MQFKIIREWSVNPWFCSLVVVAQVKQEVGDVDILVNNAGIVTGTKFLDSPDSMNIKTMDINCNAHFWTVKAFLPAMLKKNRGHVVSLASAAGLFGVSGLSDYCASKFAAVGFDESLRAEIAKMGKTGVKTTVVCPFYINTGMFEGAQSRILPISVSQVLGKLFGVSETMDNFVGRSKSQ